MTSTNPSFSLRGKTALVTGAGRGLGLEMARGLAAAGATVIVNGREAAGLEEAAAQIRQAGGQAGGDARAMAFDVTDYAAVRAGLAQIEEEDGGLDILVNNVGARDRRGLFDFSLDDVRALMEIDLIAPFELSRETARHMMAAGRAGRIINVTSIAGPLSRAGDAAYTAAKGGLAALTRALAAELGPFGITANAIAPGFFATEANQAMVEDERIGQWVAMRTSLERWGEPAEIAGAAVFLASPAASYVTGQVIFVDGGLSAHF